MAACVLAVAAATAAACGGFDGDDGASDDAGADAPPADDAAEAPVDGGAEAAPDDAAPDATDAGDAGRCPVGIGPEMVVVDVADHAFCIDRTEVTDTQYATFRVKLDAPGLAALAPRLPPPCDRTALVAIDREGALSDLPRVNLAFCSAAAYCAAQGKRLCGGLDGGAVVLDGGTEEPTLEWEVACANDLDTTRYPWGTTPGPSAAAGCQTQDLVDGGRRPVGTAAACGATGGPLDMIGNVWEYVNVRRDFPTDAYTGLRGGSYAGRTVGNGCETLHGSASGARGAYTATPVPDVGFRCCADVRP